MFYAKRLFYAFPVMVVLTVTGVLNSMEAYGQQQTPTNQTMEFQDIFNLEDCSFNSRGSNTYFILEPGHQSILEAQEDGKMVELIITVLNETKVVNGT
jgi:hypothetical protein